MRIVAVTLALLVALAGCTGAAPGETTIYSGRTEELVRPVLEQFAEDEGVDIAIRAGDSAELALLIDEEGDSPAADVFYSQAPGATGFLAERGRLAELPAELLERVDARFRSGDDRWIGVTARQRVLVYNTDLVAEADLPSSVLEVTDMASDVAIAPANGSFQDFVTALRLEAGEDAARAWLEAMAEGDAPTYANNSAIVEAVSRGEVPMGLVNHYYAYRFLDEDPDLPIANHVFEESDIGSILIPSTLSVVAGAQDAAGGEQLIAWMLDEEAQQYFAEETKEYPLASGVEPAEEIPPLDVEAATAIDIDALGEGLSDTLDLIREAGLQG